MQTSVKKQASKMKQSLFQVILIAALAACSAAKETTSKAKTTSTHSAKSTHSTHSSKKTECQDYAEYAAKFHGPASKGPLKLPQQRPPTKCRTFTSDVINDAIDDVSKQMKNPDLARLFSNAYPNTLDTTVNKTNECVDAKSTCRPEAYIITGDIPAMWIRDSTSQMTTYLPYIKQDASLQRLMLGVLYAQADYLNIDTYAGAFKIPDTGAVNEDAKAAHTTLDKTKAKQLAANTGNGTDTIKKIPFEVWEEKYEIDSLAHFLRLSYQYWNATGDGSFVKDKGWSKAVNNVLKVVQDQQKPTFNGSDYPTKPKYTFLQSNERPTETQFSYGWGNPTANTGMVRSMFRPSDDATTFPHFVPGNAMLSVELMHLSEILNATKSSAATAKTAASLSVTIKNAIYDNAIVDHPKYGKIFAYEVDGFGSTLLMDDANVPSLLSLSYLGFIDQKDPLYQNTRNFVLSKSNPWFFDGTRGSGIGGPHVGYSYAWPMSQIVRILTSSSDAEITEALNIILNNTDKTGLIHESFDVFHSGASHYTRPWFSWANGLFGQAILQIARERPHLIF